MHKIEFREITFSNFSEIAELEVKPSQMGFVADNAYSTAQSILDPEGYCRSIYAGDQAVGFFYCRLLEMGDLLYICRYMVDKNHQGKGIGYVAMMKILSHAFEEQDVDMVDLAVSEHESSAEGFYKRCGLVSTGEAYKGGIRMYITREHYLTKKVAEQVAASDR